MKRIIALILVLMLLFTSCDTLPIGQKHSQSHESTQSTEKTDQSPENTQGNEHTHSYSANVISPTCLEGGYTTYTCSGCDDTYVADATAALGHTEVTVPGKAATETESGLTDGKKCSTCGTVTVGQNVIPATGSNQPVHAHSYTTDITEPTCAADGYTTYTCSGCNDSYTSNLVQALGHSEKTVSGKAATCTESGLTNGKECTTCGTVTVEQTTIPATGHTETIIPGKAATATEDGLTDGKKCTVCGTVTVAQTVIVATGHSYTANVTAPTCAQDGYTTYTCADCGDSYISNYVPAVGHTEVALTGKAATCTASGLTEGKECTVCGTVTVEQTTIAAIGHTEVIISGTEATCTSTGLTDGKECSVCDTVTVAQTTISKIAHSEVTVSGTAATCTASGLSDGKKCSVCGTVTVQQTAIPAIGHTEVTVSGTAATCTASGLSDGKKCSVCGTVTVVQVTISATGHNWKDATTEAPKTCQTCGVTEGEKLPSSTGSTTAYDTLYVNYIDVGQGDSILIKVGDCDILIDAGDTNKGSVVSSYLKSQNVDDIELMINTHPDADHCGGLPQVLKDFAVEAVWASPFTKSTTAYKNFTSAVSSEGLSVKNPSVGTVFTYEYLTLTVIYSGAGTSNSNDSSIVVMLQYGSFKFLFTGDISTTIENKLVGSADLGCDVLKVPHHGSSGSNSAAFLSATGAEYAVICVGADNSYGHPKSDALSRLTSAGMSIYRTDEDGSVVFSTNGATLTTPGGNSVSGGSGSGSSGGSSSGGTSGDSSSSDGQIFIGNTETKVFHLPTCSNLPATSKQNQMYNYYWIINIAGYTPCGKCLKNYTPGSGSSSGTAYIANTESKVYHVSTCSYLPAASKQTVIYNTTGYTPCGHCIKSTSTTSYIANTETKVYHLSTCSYLPAASKQAVIYDTSGYTPCGHCIK